MHNYLKDLILGTSSKLISYADYLENVLYHSDMGYYMKESEKIGKKGDFITTSNYHDIYGRLIAKWYARIVEKYSLVPAVCEIGAGNGRFAKAFIDEWEICSNQNLTYFIVEQSPYHRTLQNQLLQTNDAVKQIDELEDLTSFNGLIFSNELFDALPVNVIEKKNNELMEVMITIENNQLVEKLIPLSNEPVLHYLNKSGLRLKNNQRIEIPLQMEKMIKTISNILERGLVLTVDYGYTNDEWAEPRNKSGSLRGYYKHKQIENVLTFPGEMDITSHIHFDFLIQEGEENDLRFEKKIRQDEFLISIGALDELKDHVDTNPFSEVSKRNRAIRSLIMPTGISAYFHVVLQSKGMKTHLRRDFI